MKPLLSICIPTYNRAQNLKDTLEAIVPQLAQCGEKVELIVCDNCSTDGTQELVEKYLNITNFHYHRNEKNIGGNPNILKQIAEMASGDFGWVIGDDDIIRDGGVSKILDIIKSQPDIDFIFVNYILDITPEPIRNRLFEGSTDLMDGKSRYVASRNLVERSVSKWEELLPDDMSFLSAMYASVFRVSVARKATSSVKIGESFSNLDSTFPHLMVFQRSMVGHKAYATGIPWVICGTNATWTKFSFAALLRLEESIDVQRSLGIDNSLIEQEKRAFIASHANYMMIWKVASLIGKREIPFADEFHLNRFIVNNLRFKEMRASLLWMIKNVPGLVANI